jgi:hypothetical protein
MASPKKKAKAKPNFKFKDLDSKKNPKAGCHAFSALGKTDKAY